jgi:hypothetical protein
MSISKESDDVFGENVAGSKRMSGILTRPAALA